MGGKSKALACGTIDNYKLVIFGSGAVGKSSLVRRFVHEDFSSTYVPTVEDVYQYFLQLNDRLFNLTIVDTAGTHDFPAMRKLSISECSAFILVLAMDDRQSFEDFKRDTLEVLRSRPDARILVAGNKTDVQERTISAFEIINYMERLRPRYPSLVYRYLETSAKDNTNVREVFIETVRLLKPCVRKQYTAKKTNKSKKLHRLAECCTIS